MTTILFWKKINVSCMASFCLGKYRLSSNTFWLVVNLLNGILTHQYNYYFYYYIQSTASGDDVLLIFSSGLFWCLDRYYQSFKGTFLTPRFLWEYMICFGRLLSLSLFKWSVHLRLCCVSIKYMSVSLGFSRMNLFGRCCSHFTFSILTKWRLYEDF